LACLCLIFWPFSYQNFVTRAEPLLLTLTLAAFYFYWTATGWRRFSVVLLSVFLATAAKPNGFVTGLALMATEGLLQLRDKRYEWSDSTLWLRGVLLAVATFAPLALLSLHMGLYTGEPLAWVHIQKTWAVSAEFSFASIITAYFPQAMVGRWGWDATIFNAVVLVVTLWILIYFTATRRRDPHYWPLIIESAIIQIVSGALFFGYVFNRHSLPIVLNYLGAGISARTARAVVVLGAGFQGMAGALAALRVIHILA